MEQPKLEENVYPLTDKDAFPVPSQSNKGGDVLWFVPAFGWVRGSVQWPPDGATHWTFCPDPPPDARPMHEQVEAGFKAWLATYPAEFPAAARSLLWMGWQAAAKKLARMG